MSKEKKKKIKPIITILEEDIKFEKMIQFSGWIFLLVLAGFMGVWGLMDLLDIAEINLEAMSYSFILFTGTSSALSFGLATRIKKNRDKKKEIFMDWLLGEFIFSVFAIFAVAAYQW
ncbi:MAG: hypothetical protein ACTSRI_10710 [Promethearchaeota archaeon]